MCRSILKCSVNLDFYCFNCTSLLRHLLGTWWWWCQISATTILRCFFQNDRKWCHSHNRIVPKLQSHCSDLQGSAVQQSPFQFVCKRLSQTLRHMGKLESVPWKFCIPERQISTESVRRKILVIHGIGSVQRETEHNYTTQWSTICKKLI